MSDLVGDGTPVVGRSWTRFVVFAVIIGLVVTLLGYRLYTMQISNTGPNVSVDANANDVLEAIPSSRGLIYDRNGRQLVANLPTFEVVVRPGDVPFSQRDAVVAQLSTLLQLPQSEIVADLDSGAGDRFNPVRLASDVPTDVAQTIAEEHLSLPGVEVNAVPVRDYLDGPLVSQIVGYEGAVTQADLDDPALADENYQLNDLIGKTGVENTFENVLRGTYGVQQVERDAQGQDIRVVQTIKQPQPGDSLELTIDTDIQQQAQTAMDWAIQAAGLKRGVVIVMNPQTGEVLAMVSLPTYDDNLFADGISNADYQALLTDPNRPLLNFAINEQYPPGSTYKLVTGTGALADGDITPTSLVQTKTFLTVGADQTKFYDWNHWYSFNGIGGFHDCNAQSTCQWGPGGIDITQGFANSSDTFFYQLSQMLGADRLAYWAKQFGFGAPTGIALPAEASGIVPDNAWKENLFNQGMFPGEVLQAGIGQGYDSATPLQVLNAYAALANGGNLYVPQIVHRILGPDGSVVQDFQPQLIRQLPVDPSVLETMRVAARAVLTSGHTWNLVDLPLMFGGKTGTAEFGVRNADGSLPFHSWFVAFVPDFTAGHEGDITKPDSQLAVLAFAYDSNTQGDVATEVVKYFLQLHYALIDPQTGQLGDWRLPRLLKSNGFAN